MTNVNANTNQPPFWLDVKEEYIIDNFDSMILYLSRYHYSAEGENIDFDRTYSCLKKIVDRIIEELPKSNLCEVKPYKDFEESLLIRILSSYLLACHKKGVQDIKCLELLADRLILLNAVTTKEMIEKMYSLLNNCICNRIVNQYGYSWNDILKPEDFSIKTFCYRFIETAFAEDDDEPIFYYENKGLVVVRDGVLNVAPMNYTEYLKHEYINFKICDDACVLLKNGNKPKINAFEDLIKFRNQLYSTQNVVKPSQIRQLKEYSIDDEDIAVRITFKDEYLHVETIDPRYQIEKGTVYIPPFLFGITPEELITSFAINSNIRVRLQDNPVIRFTIVPLFNKFYQHYAKNYIGEVQRAVCYKVNEKMITWLTETNLLVNIFCNIDKKIQEAIDENYIISVRLTEIKKDGKGKSVINGVYESDEEYDIDEDITCDDFVANAKQEIIDAFIDWSEPDFEIVKEPESEKVEEWSVLPLSHLFYKRADIKAVSTYERYQNYIYAGIISTLCEADYDTQYISHKMDFITNMVRFAEGKNPNTLELTHKDCLKGNDEVTFREKLISELSEYKENTSRKSDDAELSGDEMIAKIDDLIKASNILINRISEQELMRIKKNIIATLGVVDMYIPPKIDDATYYGEENDSLEFKSSIVFPPKNRLTNRNDIAEPDRQKWEILKAVCGFLNTRSGGELLLGVRDNGYPCGVNDDIQYLYQNKKIQEANMDKYCLYIKFIIDGAFCDDSGIATEPKEITQVRVRYLIDKNKEGKDIIRIQVAPYEYGIISFKDKNELPDGMALSYHRSGNTTAPISDDIARQIKEIKLSIKQNGKTKKVLELQKAKKEQRVVILKDYSSYSQNKDRNVEPYKVLPDRNILIGFDLDKKKLREYKLSRFTSVEQTDKKWKNHSKRYDNVSVDIFDMMNEGNDDIHIILKLSPLPYNLLKEEHSVPDKEIKNNEGADASVYPWILDTHVYGTIGIGRFYIGLMEEIEIVKGEELKEYVRNYFDYYKSMI